MIKRLMAALTLLLLAGCATLPTQIDIKSGPELVSEEQTELSYYTPTGPGTGATAQEIVSGFLAAGTGPQNDYAVARQFLTAEFAQRWNPESGVIIRTGAPVFQAAGETLQIVEVGVGARVDEQGRYQDAILGEKVALRFQLVQQDGEWRIASAPNLTVVTQPVFAVVFNAFPVYFLDKHQSRLVPDLRWFPSKASTGTKLVNALLAGPSDWLADASSTAIPAGTKLTIDAVNVVDGVARVDFDANALEADPLQRRLLLSQLRATLLQLSGVTDVSVSINNSLQEITPSQLQSISSGGMVYFATENGIYQLSGTEATSLNGTANFMQNHVVYDFAVRNSADRIALATDQGVFEIQSTGLSLKTSQITDETSLADLFYDQWGFLWLVPENPEQKLIVMASDGEVRELADVSQGLRRSYRISSEGSRLAYSVEYEATAVIRISGIQRDPQGWPIELTDPLVVANVLGEVVDFTWQQNSVLRLLERTTSGLTAVSDYPINGPRSQLTMPPVVGRHITPGPSGLSTYMLSDSQEIWVLTGSTWRKLTPRAIAISTAG